jgi:queuine/archaeosine tRNA-ribosyltransferase
MEMTASSSNSGEVRSYAELQRQIRDALREQHPEWIEQDGDCPTCQSYESRFAELLELFESHERKSIASSEHVNACQ